MNKLKVMISLIVFLMLIDTVIAQNGDTLYDFSEGKSVEYGGTTFRGDGFSLDSAGVFSISNGKGTIGEFDSVEGDFSGKATGNGIVEGTVGKNGLKIGEENPIPSGFEVKLDTKTGKYDIFPQDKDSDSKSKLNINGNEINLEEGSISFDGNNHHVNENTKINDVTFKTKVDIEKYNIIQSEEGVNLEINGRKLTVLKDGTVSEITENTLTISKFTKVSGNFDFGNEDIRDFTVKATAGDLTIDTAGDLIIDNIDDEKQESRVYLKKNDFTQIGFVRMDITKNKKIDGINYPITNVFQGFDKKTVIKSFFDKGEVLVFNPKKYNELIPEIGGRPKMAGGTVEYLIQEKNVKTIGTGRRAKTVEDKNNPGKIITVKVPYRYLVGKIDEETNLIEPNEKINAQIFGIPNLYLKYGFKVLETPNFFMYNEQEAGTKNSFGINSLADNVKSNLNQLDFKSRDGIAFDEITVQLKQKPAHIPTPHNTLEDSGIAQNDPDLKKLTEFLTNKKFGPKITKPLILGSISYSGKRLNLAPIIEKEKFDRILADLGFTGEDNWEKLRGSSDEKKTAFINAYPSDSLYLVGLNSDWFLDTVKSTQYDFFDYLGITENRHETNEVIYHAKNKDFVIVDLKNEKIHTVPQGNNKPRSTRVGITDPDLKKDFVNTAVIPILEKILFD